MREILEYLLKYNGPLTQIFILGMAIVATIFALYYIRARKKYHALSHQIPANVVKDYLDSIIQNSSSLKSSLFRGGGEYEGTPSILPVADLNQGSSGIPDSEYRQKLAMISSLESDVKTKSSTISDLEEKIKELEVKVNSTPTAEGGVPEDQHNLVVTENSDLKKQIEDLNKKVAEGGANDGGGDEAIIKERDELKERLQEYEIIEDDLANLKRLQQENEQLKKALEAAGGKAPEAAVAAPAAEPVAEPAEEVEPAVQAAAEAPDEAPQEAPEPAGEAPAEAPEVKDEQGKSAEDLLSEFEKMLG